MPKDSSRFQALAGRLSDTTHGSPATWARHGSVPRPARRTVIEAVEALRGVLFPGYFGATELNARTAGTVMAATLQHVQSTLQGQIARALCFAAEQDGPLPCEPQARAIAERFIDSLPELQRILMTDVQAAYEGDPAATSPDEAILCYPGLLAVTSYRLAHQLHLEGVPLLPRILCEHAHSLTGIDIHPGARIQESFFIDHGTGVVIGETCEIGRQVRIYQGVTLGARSFPLDEFGNPIKGIKRHPIVEDEVTIYSGATILGPVVIGRGSVIGGNVWLTRSVPAGSTVTQSAARSQVLQPGEGI